MRLALELVLEGLQLRGFAEAMSQSLRKQPVGEPRVARQQRSVQIRPDRAADTTALPAAHTVVAETGDDPTERDGARIEPRPPGVVLEARERSADTRLQLALEQDVADHPPLAGHRLEREEPDPGQVDPLEVAIRPTEELIPAAHRQHGRACLRRGQHAVRLRDEVARDERLFPVLAAADVQQIVIAGSHRIADADRRHPEVVTPPGGAPREHRDVAAVGLDVEVVRILMSDPQLHAARSQYGRTNPRRATIFRSASIAV